MPKSYPRFGGILRWLKGPSSHLCVVCKTNPGRRHVCIEVTHMRGEDEVHVICQEEACLHKIRREPELFSHY